MTAQTIKVGDIVRCDVRGHRFYAEVTDKLRPCDVRADQVRGQIIIMPITAGVTYRAVKPREVVELYRKARRRAPVQTDGIGQIGRWRNDA